jgi:Pectinacetylesterase
MTGHGFGFRTLALLLVVAASAATLAACGGDDGRVAGAAGTNPSNRQIRVYLGPGEARELSPILTSSQVAGLAAHVRQLAAQLDGAAVLRLHSAVPPGAPSHVVGRVRVRYPLDLAKRVESAAGRSYVPQSQLYVATTAVLRHLGIDPDKVAAGTDFLADRSVPADELVIPTEKEEFAVTNVQRIDIGRYRFDTPHGRGESRPPTLITLEGLRRHGWAQTPAGWLLESSRPLTGDQIAAAGELAADTGLTMEVTAETKKWKKVAPGGDCECADGSEFAFWERRDDPTKVVFFLDGGGACFDAKSCAFTGLGTGGEANYDWSIYGEDPAQEGGIFDFPRVDNPFREYSFIYVPLCTGDMHLGDVTRKYSPELTVEHNGFVNGTAALSYLAEHYPDAAQVVVVGKTNGAAPLYSGLVADLLPDAQVTVLGGQSGHIPDDPDLNAEIGELWGAYGTMPDWEVNEGLTARDWGLRRFWIQAGLHDPDIVLARFDFAYDREAAGDAQVTGVDSSDQLAVIDANEAAIEEAGVVLHSYTAPGDDHGIFEWDRFYEVEVNGETLVDWVTRLIEGEPVEDVHCQECRVT